MQAVHFSQFVRTSDAVFRFERGNMFLRRASAERLCALARPLVSSAVASGEADPVARYFEPLDALDAAVVACAHLEGSVSAELAKTRADVQLHAAEAFVAFWNGTLARALDEERDASADEEHRDVARLRADSGAVPEAASADALAADALAADARDRTIRFVHAMRDAAYDYAKDAIGFASPEEVERRRRACFAAVVTFDRSVAKGGAL